MDTLDRFLVKELTIYFLLLLFGLAALAVGFDFLSKFWNTGMAVSKVIEIYLYKIPSAIQQFVPVACLMATLLVVSTLARQNELLALYSSGVSNLRILSTFVAAVATFSTVAFIIFDPLVPAFEKKRQLVEKGLDPSQESPMQLSSGGFWYRSDHIIYNVGMFRPESNTLEDVKIFVLGPGFEIIERLQAKRALFQENDWTLEDGLLIKYPLDSPYPAGETFKTRRGVIPEKPSDYRTLRIQEETMRLKELRRYIERTRNYGLDTTVQRVFYHERVAHVFAPLIFVLLGLAFSLNPLKTQSPAKGVAFSFLVVFIYLLASRMTISVGKGGFIPPFIAAWTPNMLFLGVAVTKLFRRR